MEHKLIAFYEQTLDAHERREVEQWLAEDTAHQKIYTDTITVWQHALAEESYQFLDRQNAWNKLQQQIGTELSIEKTRVKHPSFNWRKWAAAAACIGLIVALFRIWSQSEPKQYIAKTHQQHIELKDKSAITLFKDASLLVAADFNRQTRSVTLNGDAHFDISKNPQKPFIIQSGDVRVEVLGTSFTIQERTQFHSIFVHSGKVKASFHNQEVVAVADQKIVKNNQTGQLQLAPISANIREALNTQTIRCKDIRIDSLSRMIEELYNINIKLSPSIAERKITSTYLTTESPEQIVENIALTLDVKWTKKENHFIIYE